ncbi:MAG: heme-copper oxidase subunit III [Armatimonadetes bacterium]|nr:heme-copper oxidase subunit III [Armatimonadota bacterium]
MRAEMTVDARLRGMEQNKMLMLGFIASEATFFTFLIIAYVYFRTFPETGPSARSVLDPMKTGIFSIFLIASSFTLHVGQISLRKGGASAFGHWLLVTIGFGAIFLTGQALEWNALIAEQVTISRNLFGATFYTLTGLHGLHVFVGLVFLTIVYGLTLRGDFAGGGDPAGVECLSLYWHFVDVVWILLFGIIYLGVFAG